MLKRRNQIPEGSIEISIRQDDATLIDRLRTKIAKYFFDNFAIVPWKNFEEFYAGLNGNVEMDCEDVSAANVQVTQQVTFDNICLPNPGTNLCYVNSTVQGLLSSDIIRQLINARVEDRLIEILGSITKGTLTTTEPLRSDYLPTKGNEHFKNTQQQCPSEFLDAVIESSHLKATFQHTVVESKKCTVCGYERPANEISSSVLRLPFVIDSLGNTKHQLVGNSVERVLEKFLHGTTNEFFQCKSVSFRESCSIRDHPNILAIHINRNDNSGQKSGEKIRNSRRISVSNVEYQLN